MSEAERSRPEWPQVSLREILGSELPLLPRLGSRVCCRLLLLLLGKRLVLRVQGADRLSARSDPFILVLNHSQYLEAVLLPALFSWYRGGKLVHFLADWNFLLVPLVSSLFRRGEVVPIARKPARPRFLTRLRRFLIGEVHGFDLAKLHLRNGTSIGVFPEGTVNRHPRLLLAGYPGAARLSIECGVPILPVGVRYAQSGWNRPISVFSPMDVTIGDPIHPGESRDPAPPDAVRAWHEHVMREVAMLCRKKWHPKHSRKRLC